MEANDCYKINCSPSTNSATIIFKSKKKTISLILRLFLLLFNYNKARKEMGIPLRINADILSIINKYGECWEEKGL